MYLGDCLQVMSGLGVVDHVLTDAPYEVEAHTKSRRALKDATQRKGAVNTGEVRRIDQPLEISFPAITEAERHSASKLFFEVTRRWVVTFCQIEGITPWRIAYKEAGIEWIRGGIWRKTNGAPQFTGDRPGQGFECLAIGHRPGKKLWNGGGKHAVWTFPIDHGAGGKRRLRRPTQKPIRLMEALVADFTNEGELVLDAFAGTGTTGVACLRLGRKFIGIERDRAAFDIENRPARASVVVEQRRRKARWRKPRCVGPPCGGASRTQRNQRREHIMGTRCLTRVFDGDKEIACIYRHYDGYPDGHGQELVDMLADKRCVNGYSSGAKLPKEQRLNGPGRVAAFIVAALFADGRDPDIMPPGTSDIWEDYEYHVKCPTLEAIEALKGQANYDGLPISVECFDIDGGYSGKPRVLQRVSIPDGTPIDASVGAG